MHACISRVILQVKDRLYTRTTTVRHTDTSTCRMKGVLIVVLLVLADTHLQANAQCRVTLKTIETFGVDFFLLIVAVVT